MKIGIRYGYPILRKKFFEYMVLIRPYTAFIAFIVGWILGIKYVGFLSIKPVIIGLTFAFGQIMGQVINQIADIDIDRINKPYRPLVKGTITKTEAEIIALLALVLSITTSALLSIYFILVNMIILFFSAFYSLEPIRAKKHLWSYLWMAISRGLLPPLAVSIGLLGIVNKKLLGLGIVAFTWVLAYQVTKDIGDEEGDSAFGIKTLPVVYGIKKTIMYMKTMTVILAIIVLVELFLNAFTVYGLSILPIGASIPYSIRKETITENNMGWTMFYAGLGLIYLSIMF